MSNDDDLFNDNDDLLYKLMKCLAGDTGPIPNLVNREYEGPFQSMFVAACDDTVMLHGIDPDGNTNVSILFKVENGKLVVTQDSHENFDGRSCLFSHPAI